MKLLYLILIPGYECECYIMVSLRDIPDFVCLDITFPWKLVYILQLVFE